MTEKWVQGKWKFLELAGLFELSEFELPGLYCNKYHNLFCIFLYITSMRFLLYIFPYKRLYIFETLGEGGGELARKHQFTMPEYISDEFGIQTQKR